MRCSLYLPLVVLLGFKYVSSEAENGSAFLFGSGNGCTHGKICLVSGKTKNTGRLQICYNGRWGSVCDDLFGDVDASVACRQLGYETGGSVLERGFTDGGDDLPTLLDDVRCKGNESRLIDCDHQTENGSNCAHSEDVGLQCGRCTEGDVRLQHGNNDVEGIVELCVGGKWGAVCNEKWDNFDATVVCRQLGFQDFSMAKNGNHYTGASVSAHVTNVSCSGSESQLTDCTYTILSGASCSVDVAGVECQTTPCNSGQFWCPETKGECISQVHVCDHSSNCSKASDERDCASFMFSNSTYYVNESAGHVSVCVTGEFPANPLFSSGSVIPLTLTTITTTASSQDYDSLANYSLELTHSDPTVCVNITIVDDTELELIEQFLLVLNIGENTTLNFYQGLTSTAVVKIIENDGCSPKEFFCYSRQQCLPLSRKCDGVLDCFHCCQNVGTDESDCRVKCEDGAIQLIEWSEGEGAVEVCKNGRFHRIESPGWDQREATVVCKKLHPSRDRQEWAGIEQLAPVVFSFSLTDTVSGYNCRGNETDIRNCTLTGPQLGLGSGQENESQSLLTKRVAGVKCIAADNCTEGELRTVGGEREGRVEVCHNQLWGAITVRDGGKWGLAEAGVVCRERGFEPAGAIAQTSSNPDLSSPEVTWPATIYCSGSEHSLQQCNITIHDGDISTNTAQSAIAGYKCRDLPRHGCASEKFRLSEMTRRKGITSGLLEVCQNDTWMSVCNSTWSEQGQQEVCKQLSHVYSTQTGTKAPLFPLNPPLAAVSLREECIGRNDPPPQCAQPPPPSSSLLSAQEKCQSWTRVSCVELPSISFYPLGVGMNRSEYILTDGQQFQLTCSTDHFNVTSIRIERGNVTVAMNGSNMITVIGTELIKEEMTGDEEAVYQCVVETGRQFISTRNFSVSIEGKSSEWSTVHLRFSTVLVNKLPLLGLVNFWLLDLISLQLEGIQNVNCSLLDQTRQEDIEIQLSRIECVISVYPPTEDILEVAESIAKTLPKIHPGFSSVSISSKGFCNAGFDELRAGGQVYWPEAKAGDGPITRPCPGSGHRTTTRKCNHNSIWAPPDYRSCHSIEDISDMISNITADNVVEVLDLLRIVVSTAPAEEQNNNAVMVIATAFHNVSKVLRDGNSSAQLTVEERENITADASAIIDSLLSWDSNVLRNNGSEIVNSFEDILEYLITSDDFEAFDVIGDNIILLAETVSASTYTTGGISFFVTKQEEQFNISLDAIEENSSTVASGTLPDTLFQFQSEEKRVGLSFFIYEEPFLFPLPRWSSNESGTATLVGTPVVSLIVAEGSVVRQRSRIDPPVVINLTVTQVDPKNVTDIHCVFWNFETEEWDSEGCETYPADDKSRVSCKCNHLTNFAALVDICRRTDGCETSSKAEYALSILSIVGVSLSLVGLAVTIFTMSFFKRLRKRDATKFHIQLCVAMFCMLLVFLSGLRRSYARESCITVSLLIHYFTLATVLWMGAEAVLMFQKLVIVFVRITKRYLIIVSIICWVIPIVPVAIPVAINPSYVIIEPERGSAGFCFISNTAAFFAAFLAPILAVILFNSVIFITVVVVLIRHKYNTSLGGAKKQKERRTTLRLIISIIGIMSIYGLTWLFGALTVEDASLAFQIIFVILNSLQGFFIFLFFCVLGREGRELWIEVLFCGMYKSTYLHPSSASSTGGRYGRKNSRFLSTSDPVSVVEKTLSCTNVGPSFVINYMELQTKKAEVKEENGKIVIKTDIDKEAKHPALKPNEKSVADKKVNGTSSHNNGTVHSTHLNGHAKTLVNGHSNGGIVSAEPPEESSMPATQEAMKEGEVERKAQAEGVQVEEEPAQSKSAGRELNPQLGDCSSRRGGRDPAGTFEVDFDNTTVQEV